MALVISIDSDIRWPFKAFMVTGCQLGNELAPANGFEVIILAVGCEAGRIPVAFQNHDAGRIDPLPRLRNAASPLTTFSETPHHL